MKTPWSGPRAAPSICSGAPEELPGVAGVRTLATEETSALPGDVTWRGPSEIAPRTEQGEEDRPGDDDGRCDDQKDSRR